MNNDTHSSDWYYIYSFDFSATELFMQSPCISLYIYLTSRLWTSLSPIHTAKICLRVQICTWADLHTWVKVNLLCVQTRVMYREQIPKHHLKLGNRLLQTCEFSQKLGVSLLFEYIGLAGGCSRLRETKIKRPIHRLLRQNHNIIIFEDDNWNEKGMSWNVAKCWNWVGVFSVGT